ncbi:DNA-processing protein DprA [Nocardioides sp.]|uniref:DNA-processing protein DprA n=1 Tax=Nocardioides sp. TaxID=35761 RepID=UPI002614D0CF|nr:DNA-processing protein DprA [Nocardioides sp.]
MSVSEQERLARVALSRLTEPGDLRLAALTDELGAVTLHQLLADERDLMGLQTDVAARLTGIEPERELEQASRLGLRFVVPGDEEWPVQVGDLAGLEPLHERGGVPIGLWVKGPLRLSAISRSVAVVGSRASTSYGAHVAGEMGAVAAMAGTIVVSGAAFGIDDAAHRGALSVDGPTVAVLACGADRVYPAAHRELIARIASSGAVVSEAAPGCAPQRIRFLARNRLIAALTSGTVVVEAATRSGALNTSNWAGRLNRVVMGVPGPVTSVSSTGVHEQLRTGAMSLVTSGSDVLELIGESGTHLVEPARAPQTVRDRLTARQRQVLDAVPVAHGVGADSLARVAGLGLLEVRSALAALQRAGLVMSDEGGWRITVLAHA